MFDFVNQQWSGKRLLQAVCPVSAPRCRLICFPCAGGSAAMFRHWPAQLPSDIEVVALHAPGRGARFSEAAYDAMDPLVDDLLQEFRNLTDVPYLIFGHSLGARIAYELCHRAESLGLALPEHFVAAGSRSPDIPCFSQPTYDLPEPAFVAKLAELGGTPSEILQNEEMLSLLLPCLRADFRIAECYTATSIEPLCCPITVYVGKQDPRTPADAVTSWQRFSPYALEIKRFDGGHFFVNDNAAVTAAIGQMLQSLLTES
jgi:medium-chain acyl-[acyl-carrier-protein] hydrolase